jgi:hypothetical protein
MARTVAAAFNSLLSDLKLTPRQRSLAQGRIRHLLAFFARYEVSRTPCAIGSYGRGTVIRRERDVDVMVVLAAKPYVRTYQRDSRQFLYWLRDALNNEYSNTTVSTRQVALCMDLGEGLGVDLIPVFDAVEADNLSLLTRRPFLKPGEMGFYMPNGRGDWQRTNPPFHDALILQSDQRLGGNLKPLVRLMKLWNENEYRRLDSFHLEMMVEQVWRKAKQMPPLPIALAQTLDKVADLADGHFHDPWSKGDWLDRYLDADLERRRKAVNALRDDATKAQAALAFEANGNSGAAFERWSVVFGHDFPAFG